MACANSIIQGYTKSCRDAQAGVKKFYVTEHANIASYTQASGVITALTMVSGKKFWLYEQGVNTANGVEVPTPSRINGTFFVDQTFNAVLLKRQAALSYSLRALAQQDLAIIWVEQSGEMFLLGAENGMAMDPSNSPTGTAAGDRNGYELVFKGQEPNMAPTVPANILATVIV